MDNLPQDRLIFALGDEPEGLLEQLGGMGRVAGCHGAGVSEARDVMKGKKGKRACAGVLGPVGDIQGKGSGQRHLAPSGGDPGGGETNVRLDSGYPREERLLRFGVTLEILVSKAGQIGKYTRLAIRRGKLPERVDMCLDPAGLKPLVCPSS